MLPGMTSTGYRKAIAALGLNQRQAGEFLNLTDRTSRSYAAYGPPVVVAMLLLTMIKHGISVDDVNELMKRK
jgi:hypothetical protein